MNFSRNKFYIIGLEAKLECLILSNMFEKGEILSKLNIL